MVAFGDRITAVLLQIAIKMTVEMYKSIDLQAGERLLNNMSVDDLTSGGEMEEVQRFMGSCAR